MPLTDDELAAIEKRNVRRAALRQDVGQHKWEYDSFAFLEPMPDGTPPPARPCILVRERAWFDQMTAAHGTDVFDRGRTGNLAPAHVGQYVEAALNDPIERDVSALLAEIRRLRAGR